MFSKLWKLSRLDANNTEHWIRHEKVRRIPQREENICLSTIHQGHFGTPTKEWGAGLRKVNWEFKRTRHKTNVLFWFSFVIQWDANECEALFCNPHLRGVYKEHLNHTRSQAFQFSQIPIGTFKDKTENLKKCGIEYHIHCEQCDKQYVGETSCVLETRIKEHLSRSSSLFMNIASSRGIWWIPAKQKFLPREAIRSNAA